MNNLIFLITSRLDDQSLELLSSVFSLQMKKLQLDQEWWFLRVEHLVGRQLKRRIEGNWKNAYRILSQLDLSKPTRSKPDSLANSVLIEIGKHNFYSCGEDEDSLVIVRYS